MNKSLRFEHIYDGINFGSEHRVIWRLRKLKYSKTETYQREHSLSLTSMINSLSQRDARPENRVPDAFSEKNAQFDFGINPGCLEKGDDFAQFAAKNH